MKGKIPVWSNENSGKNLRTANRKHQIDCPYWPLLFPKLAAQQLLLLYIGGRLAPYGDEGTTAMKEKTQHHATTPPPMKRPSTREGFAAEDRMRRIKRCSPTPPIPVLGFTSLRQLAGQIHTHVMYSGIAV
jgi:hypothetical protein